MSTDRNEALRLAAYLDSIFISEDVPAVKARKIAALLRQQAERIAELEVELKATSDKLQDLQSTFDYVRERRAQIYHRLWVWAHEELSEPLKTRYFNIVANGTADVMEQPTYAQQYNAQKHRADAAEAERDQLRAEVSELRAALWHVKHVAKDVEAAKTIAGDAIDHARTTHKDEG